MWWPWERGSAVLGHGACRPPVPAARGARRFQLRCLLGQPLTVAAGGLVTGELRLTAHKRQSYDVHLTLSAPALVPGGAPQTVRPTPPRPAPGRRALHYRQCLARAGAGRLMGRGGRRVPSPCARRLAACPVERAALGRAQARSKLDLKEPYYRQLNVWNFQAAAIPAPQQAAAWAHANGNGAARA
jgi:hypothetical protein